MVLQQLELPLQYLYLHQFLENLFAKHYLRGYLFLFPTSQAFLLAVLAGDSLVEDSQALVC
jgi:hypothetical protein